jgi:hypothetical protein
MSTKFVSFLMVCLLSCQWSCANLVNSTRSSREKRALVFSNGGVVNVSYIEISQSDVLELSILLLGGFWHSRAHRYSKMAANQLFEQFASTVLSANQLEASLQHFQFERGQTGFHARNHVQVTGTYDQ